MLSRLLITAWILSGAVAVASDSETPPTEPGTQKVVFQQLLESTADLRKTELAKSESVAYNLVTILKAGYYLREVAQFTSEALLRWAHSIQDVADDLTTKASAVPRPSILSLFDAERRQQAHHRPVLGQHRFFVDHLSRARVEVDRTLGRLPIAKTAISTRPVRIIFDTSPPDAGEQS